MKSLSEFSEKQSILFLTLLNCILKIGFIFTNALPSDVGFYAATGWLLNHGFLPYQSFDNNNFDTVVLLNRVHPNGPLNYLFYGILESLFGTSDIVIKLPWLIAEIFIAIYLYKLGMMLMTHQKAFWMSIIYTLFFPSYYLAIFLGCDEIITGAFALMGIYYFLNHRSSLAGLFLGLGISYKYYPLFFFLPMWIYSVRNKQLKELVISLFISLGTYLIISLPYLILIPTDFFVYNFGLVNRFITVSIGYYFQNSWFYSALFIIPGINLSIDPHLIFAIALVGFFFLWDWFGRLKRTPTRPYDVSSFLGSSIYYVAILPIISISFNYRYLLWLFPLMLIYFFPKFNLNINKIEHNVILQSSLSRLPFEKKLWIWVILSLICNYLIIIINLIQNSINLLNPMLFGTADFNGYIWTGIIILSLNFIFLFLTFRLDFQFLIMYLFACFQAIGGFLIYISFELRGTDPSEYTFLAGSLFFLVLSYVLLAFLMRNIKINKNKID
jgi:hypothetical protein